MYGHLTYPLVEAFGGAWLGDATDKLRLHKPAYHNDTLRLELNSSGEQHHVTCANAQGELLAELHSQHPAAYPDPVDAADLDGDYKYPERVEISWDSVQPGQPLTPWQYEVTAADNRTYTTQIDDSLSIYSQGAAHPHLLLSLANQALMHEYIMPTWIHVGSETRHRAPVKVGDTLTVRCLTQDKWARKGHEFIKLYVSFWRDGELTTDIEHTAIFKVAS